VTVVTVPILNLGYSGVKGAGAGQGAIPCDPIGAIYQVGSEPG